MTNLKDVIRDMMQDAKQRWELDQEMPDDERQYASYEQVIDEVTEEYMQ
jgi:hypothetical protein